MSNIYITGLNIREKTNSINMFATIWLAVSIQQTISGGIVKWLSEHFIKSSEMGPDKTQVTLTYKVKFSRTHSGIFLNDFNQLTDQIQCHIETEKMKKMSGSQEDGCSPSERKVNKEIGRLLRGIGDKFDDDIMMGRISPDKCMTTRSIHPQAKSGSKPSMKSAIGGRKFLKGRKST